MGAKSQKKGADGERELVEHLRRAGYSVSWGGNRTYGAVPDASGLPGVHIECKRVEQLNIARAMEQASGMALQPCSTEKIKARGSSQCS